MAGKRTEERVEQVPVNDIIERRNPRSTFEPDKLANLSASIQARGIQEPLLLRRASKGKLEVISGSRRLRAAKLAGLKSVPGIVRESPEREAAADAIVVNLVRENLAPWELATGYDRLIREYEWTVKDIAAAVGLDERTVQETMSLLTLAEPVKFAIQSRKLSAMHGATLARVQDKREQVKLFERIQESGLSAKEARDLVAEKAVTVRRPGRPRKARPDGETRAPTFRKRRSKGTIGPHEADLRAIREKVGKLNSARIIYGLYARGVLVLEPDIGPGLAKEFEVKTKRSSVAAGKALAKWMQNGDERLLRELSTMAMLRAALKRGNVELLEFAKAALGIE